jgi:hypothetical protein
MVCEPSHSVVQFRDNDDDDQNLSAQGGSYKRAMLTTKLRDFAKRVKSWFHVSRLGYGHSEAVGNVLSTVSLWDMDSILTRYEGHWWNRTVVFDGWFRGPSFDKEFALEAATEYCHNVCTGNLSLLRQFLKTSLQKTKRHDGYADAFRLMLNEKGKRQFEWDVKKKLKKSVREVFSSPDPALRAASTNLVLGYTRKRHLLIPEWADDNTLWTP